MVGRAGRILTDIGGIFGELSINGDFFFLETGAERPNENERMRREKTWRSECLGRANEMTFWIEHREKASTDRHPGR